LLLAKGADPDIPGRSGATPLTAAALKGNDRIVEQLLSQGADPNVVDANGRAAISYAAARGFFEVVRRLLDAGVDADAGCGHGLTPLMWAAGHGDDVGVRSAESVVGLLLDRGARLDRADDRGRTALMMAAELGHVELVEILAGRGADPTARGKDGKGALDLAANDGVRQILTSLRPGHSSVR
jgi:ankyrin repeat protein